MGCKQPVSLPTGCVVAVGGSGLPPDMQSVCAEVRVAPLKRAREENQEVASVHFARPESDCLKVMDSTKTVRPHVGRLYATF